MNFIIQVSCVVAFAFIMIAFYRSLSLSLLSIVLFFASYFFTQKFIPIISQFLLRKKHYGLDLNKKGTKQGQITIPEPVGLASSLICVSQLFIMIIYWKMFYPSLLTEHYSLTIAVIFSILLGFIDDILDIPWRYKLVLPMISMISVVAAYQGHTFLYSPLIQIQLQLSYLMHIYIALLVVFCTNSINIHAGINGIQVGQAIIIGCFTIIYNSLIIIKSGKLDQLAVFSILVTTTFVYSSCSLYKFNKYPSKVFVGDTFCYFSGTLLAAIGINGQFPIIILFFFIPQILNFLYSFPQLLGIWKKCPRHRLPRFNVVTGNLQSIREYKTLINLFLFLKGPTTEKRTCQILLLFQVICCCLVLIVIQLLQ